MKGLATVANLTFKSIADYDKDELAGEEGRDLNQLRTRSNVTPSLKSFQDDVFHIDETLVTMAQSRW
jgi:hypothetical protein